MLCALTPIRQFFDTYNKVSYGKNAARAYIFNQYGVLRVIVAIHELFGLPFTPYEP